MGALFSEQEELRHIVTYFCTYVLRKPFTAAIYKSESLFGIDLTLLFVTAQVVGYTLSMRLTKEV
jgi:hypothetical protein